MFQTYTPSTVLLLAVQRVQKGVAIQVNGCGYSDERVWLFRRGSF